MRKQLLAYAAILGATAAVFGAFGAHALKSQLTERGLEIFQTGVTYQLYHALALLGLACIPGEPTKFSKWGGNLFLVGLFFFLAHYIYWLVDSC